MHMSQLCSNDITAMLTQLVLFFSRCIPVGGVLIVVVLITADGAGIPVALFIGGELVSIFVCDFPFGATAVVALGIAIVIPGVTGDLDLLYLCGTTGGAGIGLFAGGFTAGGLGDLALVPGVISLDGLITNGTGSRVLIVILLGPGLVVVLTCNGDLGAVYLKGSTVHRNFLNGNRGFGKGCIVLDLQLESNQFTGEFLIA